MGEGETLLSYPGKTGKVYTVILVKINSKNGKGLESVSWGEYCSIQEENRHDHRFSHSLFTRGIGP